MEQYPNFEDMYATMINMIGIPPNEEIRGSMYKTWSLFNDHPHLLQVWIRLNQSPADRTVTEAFVRLIK